MGVDLGVDQAILHVAQQSNQDAGHNSEQNHSNTAQACANSDHGSVTGDDADVMPGSHAGEDQGDSSQTEQDQVVASQGVAGSVQSNTGTASHQGQSNGANQQSGQSVALSQEGGVLGLDTVVGEGQTGDDTRDNNGHSGIVGAEGNQTTEDLGNDEISNQVSNDTEDTTDDQDISLAQECQALTQSAAIVNVALLLGECGSGSTCSEAHVGAQDGAESDSGGEACVQTQAGQNTGDDCQNTGHDKCINSTNACSQGAGAESGQNVEQNHNLPPKFFFKFYWEQTDR